MASPLPCEAALKEPSKRRTNKVSTIVLFELWYGVEKSEQKESNTHRLQTFLAGPIAVLSFDEEDAKSAGEIRAALEKAGRPIGAYELLIAGQAVRNKNT